MSDTDSQVPLPDLNAADAPPAANDVDYNEDEQAARIAADLEAVFDVPVQVSAVLGRSKMEVGELLKLEHGAGSELQQFAHLHLRAAEHGRDLHRHVEHRFQVGGNARGLFILVVVDVVGGRWRVSGVEVGKWNLAVGV